MSGGEKRDPVGSLFFLWGRQSSIEEVPVLPVLVKDNAIEVGFIEALKKTGKRHGHIKITN